MPDDFIKQLIWSHNVRRRAHGVPDLRWNDQLAAQAQTWAEKVARQAHITYKEMSGLGENITFFPRDLDPDSIVEHWYEEHEKYEYETPGWQCGTNYFTQVIWRETEEVGIGRAFVEPDTVENQNRKTPLSIEFESLDFSKAEATLKWMTLCSAVQKRKNEKARKIKSIQFVGGICMSLGLCYELLGQAMYKSGKLASPGDQVIVAFYRPAGNNNRAGQFAGNVLKPVRRDESFTE